MHHPDFDYLIIGHLVRDRTADSYVLGGTASYASLTAKAFGRRTAVLSPFDEGLDISPLEGVSVRRIPSNGTTTFHNCYTSAGRTQTVLTLAETITPADIPHDWKGIPLVHIGPVTDHVSPKILESLEGSWIGLTPQGWLRVINPDRTVSLRPGQHILDLVGRANAVVLSREDLQDEMDLEEQLAQRCRILAVTDANNGTFLYYMNRRTHLSAPVHDELDPTGCGDIFAAVFFIGLSEQMEPVDAARMANETAAFAVTRPNLDAVPTSEEAARLRKKYQL